MPRGTIDRSENGRISGWVFDPAKPSASVTVSIYRDGPKGSGVLMGSFPTTVMRPDVNALFNLTGAHGFSWQVPAADQKRLHMWYVYAAGDGGDEKQVNNSPLVYPAITATAIGSRKPFLPTLRIDVTQMDIPDQPARAYRDAAGNVNLIASQYITRRAIGKTLDNVTHQCAVIHPSANDPAFGISGITNGCKRLTQPMARRSMVTCTTNGMGISLIAPVEMTGLTDGLMRLLLRFLAMAARVLVSPRLSCALSGDAME